MCIVVCGGHLASSMILLMNSSFDIRLSWFVSNSFIIFWAYE